MYLFICSYIHSEQRGNFLVYILIRLWLPCLLWSGAVCAQPPERQYLFLGDYVDRGLYSCEVALYLVSLKLAFPREVHLIRGNHETANQTATCGFKVGWSASFVVVVEECSK